MSSAPDMQATLAPAMSIPERKHLAPREIATGTSRRILLHSKPLLPPELWINRVSRRVECFGSEDTVIIYRCL